MSDVSRILSNIDAGDPHAAAELLPLVYDELRKLAAAQMAREKPGQTLDATALVHEAYVRLVGGERRGEHRRGKPGGSGEFANRAHFLAAAAEAMRRILVDRARRKNRVRHGGGRRRVKLGDVAAADESPDNLLALDETLSRLETIDPTAARLVQLRYFTGLTMPEAAAALGLTLRSAERNWTYARTWLHRALSNDDA